MKMEASTTLPVFERIPKAELPRFEVLDVKVSSMSDIFPTVREAHLKGVLGDYRGDDPDINSPLYGLMIATKRLRRQTFKHQKDEQGKLSSDAKRTLAATDLQTGLIRNINKAHLNLTGSNYSPRTTPYVIEDYVNKRDQEVYDYYIGGIRKTEGLRDRLDSGEAVDIPSFVIDKAFCKDEELLEEVQPVSAELAAEVYKENLNGKIDLNERLIKRLHFEWISSMVIIDVLRENSSSEELALAS